MDRYMMTIEEACELLIYAAETSKGGEIMVMDMGKKVNILEMAKDFVQRANLPEGFVLTGMRPGETLSEELMSEEEKTRAIKKGKFWITT